MTQSTGNKTKTARPRHNAITLVTPKSGVREFRVPGLDEVIEGIAKDEEDGESFTVQSKQKDIEFAPRDLVPGFGLIKLADALNWSLKTGNLLKAALFLAYHSSIVYDSYQAYRFFA